MEIVWESELVTPYEFDSLSYFAPHIRSIRLFENNSIRDINRLDYPFGFNKDSIYLGCDSPTVAPWEELVQQIEYQHLGRERNSTYKFIAEFNPLTPSKVLEEFRCNPFSIFIEEYVELEEEYLVISEEGQSLKLSNYQEIKKIRIVLNDALANSCIDSTLIDVCSSNKNSQKVQSCQLKLTRDSIFLFDDLSNLTSDGINICNAKEYGITNRLCSLEFSPSVDNGDIYICSNSNYTESARGQCISVIEVWHGNSYEVFNFTNSINDYVESLTGTGRRVECINLSKNDIQIIQPAVRFSVGIKSDYSSISNALKAQGQASHPVILEVNAGMPDEVQLFIDSEVHLESYDEKIRIKELTLSGTNKVTIKNANIGKINAVDFEGTANFFKTEMEVLK